MQFKSERKEHHKLTYNCFFDCIKWRLDTSIKANKRTLSISLIAKSNSFHKKLSESILNNLNKRDNSIENSCPESKNYHHQPRNLHDISENEIKIDEVVFPIKNSESSFLILESNLSKAENLNNIFFMEFDLKNSQISKEKLKHFIEINNEFVDKEMCFVLNATIHENILFEKDIKFSIETRLFIKSIQFRFENYKNSSYSRKNKEKIKNVFFAKINSNHNIGIEIYKQNILQNPNTNFNTIVNSNVILNKIFLELSIPFQMLNNRSSEKSIKGGNQNLSDNHFIHNKSNQTQSTKQKEMATHFVSDRLNSTFSPIRPQYFNYFYNQNFYELQQKALYEIKQRVNFFINPIYSINRYHLQAINHLQQFRVQNIIKKEMLNLFLNQNINKPNSINIISSYYQGQCNFLIFMNASKPYIHRINKECFSKINLNQFLSNFHKVSIFGLDISYIFEDKIVHVNYSPTLSSMDIVITETSSIECILKKMGKCDIIQDNNYDVIELLHNENFIVKYISGSLSIEFYEMKPPYSRQTLCYQINSLLDMIEGLKDILISNLNQNSWFSIMWSCLKSSNIYYQFHITDFINYNQQNDYLEIPIIGILPINLNDFLWLRTINNKSIRNYLNHTIVNSKDYQEFKQILIKSIENVNYFIISQFKKTSYDYNIFMSQKV